MAYTEYTETEDDQQFSCVRGDVWDFVLAVTGHGISEFRQGDRREAHYGTHYTRRDFEALWAGHEQLCPYYDDEKDIHQDLDAIYGTDEDSEDEWATTDTEDEWMTTDTDEEATIDSDNDRDEE